MAFFIGGNMRLTMLDDDPGEKVIPGRERITVYLDDVVVKRCLTADDEKGEVVCIMSNDVGRILVENGKPKRQTLHGIVRIERCQR